MDETTRAYVAGFFDGEGSITLGYGSSDYLGKEGLRRNYYPRIQIVIASSDENILIKIRQFLGMGHIYKTKPRGVSRKEMNYLRITNMAEVHKTMEEILTYLIVKKEQALLCKETSETLIKLKKPTAKNANWSNENLLYFNEQIKKIYAIKTSFGSLQKRKLVVNGEVCLPTL